MVATATAVEHDAPVDPLTPDEVARVRALATSSLCDADKTLALPDPAIRAIVPDVRMVGPAVTVLAPDDHLPVLAAVGEAPPGSVLVVANPRGTRAVAGLATTDQVRAALP